MLRLNYTDEHLNEMSDKIDSEFRTLENVFVSVLEILTEYDKLVESHELKQQKILQTN